MLRGLFLLVALLILALAVAIPGWIATHKTDLASPNDSDLAVGLLEEERDASGFAAAHRAAGLLVWPEDADERILAIRGGTGDPSWLGQLMASNSRAFRALQSARALDLQTAGEQDVAEVHQTALKLVTLSGVAARLSAQRGDGARAVNQAMFGMRLGREFTRSEGAGLVAMMFAEAYQTQSLEDLEAVVRTVGLSYTATLQLIEDLEASRWAPMDWHRTWAVEYQQMKQVITSIDLQAELEAAGNETGVEAAAYGLLPAGYLWQPNRTLSKTAATYRARQRRSVVACSPQRELAARVGRLGALAGAIRPNAIGNILLEVARPSFDRYEEKRCHLEARVSLVQTLAATRGYWVRHGSLPRSLSALVPSWLAAIPPDSFRDAPVQYSAASGRIWSLGADFKPSPETDIPDPADPLEPAMSVAF